MATALAPVSSTDLDGNRHYTHPVTGDELVSVTTVLGATLGKPFLTEWSARLAAEYAVDNLGLLKETLATEGRKAAVDLAKDKAKEIRERKADAGKYVHKVVESLILWAASPEGTGADIALPDLPEHLERVLYDEQPLDIVVDWMVRGFVNFVTTWNPEFLAAEMSTYNLRVGVAGTLDMIIVLTGVALKPDGTLVAAPGNRLILCVDVKTGRRLDATVPEQLSAYRRMNEALLPLGEMVAMPDTDATAVLHLRAEHRDGYRLMPLSPAADAQAWNRFRRAVDLYTGRAEVGSKPGKVAYPPRPDGTMPSPWLCDLDGEGYGRAPGALTKAGLDSLDDLASMTGKELLAAKGVGPKTVDTARRMLADHNLTLAGEEAPAGKVA